MSDEDVARSTAPSTTTAERPEQPAASHEPSQRDITDGGPHMVQFLAADGTRLPVTEVNSPYASYLEDLDGDDFRGMLRDLIMVRRVDAEGFALQRQGELGLWPSLLGQEAAQVGAGRAMRPQDYAFPGYREHGVAWCKGVAPENLLGMFRGVNHGGWDSNENNFHLYTIVIGNQMLHAVGYAMGVQRDGDVATGDLDRDTAVMAFTGDGGTSQGDYNEALVFAAVANAPVVFFVQNNHWAISQPNDRQFTIAPFRRAEGFGFPGVRVDGNDVLASYAVTRAALERARSGQGPTLIEAFTYRMGAHTTSDDPTKYRISAEVDLWKAKDPIDRMTAYLLAQGIIDDAWLEALNAEADELAVRIRTACQTMPNPPHEQMFEQVYVDPHPLVEREAREFAAYHAGFED
ncbi:MAG: pyruvate dehydrogenase (acetyl-transferring) E1 component subunit alpha [Ornithinimicrobium sp.]|uniref:pyruvate dehydrogenase (acetyl-transferring) E1 component subunit alpha n=1 Tax=Ornithinimicrobium sp. TaxID=1977084 RepID=UPI0026E0516A|nr:pyruvate dehydrogenase (acetyl-transferring) E1 component subunit alpha [Ornithinimicrobium sp.]MDO5741209.1 pyruvate dehydrogenase (acetyl-transferring) E1 component subunit alpha [Ornithinimicrobium sp.]